MRKRRAYVLILAASGALSALGSAVPLRAQDSLDALIAQLGDEQYARRENATRAIIAQGPTIADVLRSRMPLESDPEIRYRLRYILENIVLPQRAVLVLRAAPAAGLRPGDLITHINSRRVRSAEQLRRRMDDAAPSILRIHSADGPREVGPLSLEQLQTYSNYVAPRGELLARVVRLYDQGLAERSWELLQTLSGPLPEEEFSPLLRARIAYTAGAGAAAYALVKDDPRIVRPTGGPWVSPSLFDLAGPGKAPYHLEWRLWAETNAPSRDTRSDPDIRLQRVLVQARRHADTLEKAAGYWWNEYRTRLGERGSSPKPGNMLAVTAWMLSEVDLLSECDRLIKPRSAFLNHTWIRVQTDAWLPFLRGEATEALDGFYESARDVLQNPPPPQVFTRRPHIAAVIAFFLYQQPDDERIARMLETINVEQHIVADVYADWMLFGLSERNHRAVRRDLAALLPNLSDAVVARHARSLALLEYVRRRPDDDVLLAARRRLHQALGPGARESAAAFVDVLRHLAAGRVDEASDALVTIADDPDNSALRQTVAFLIDPPLSAANHPALRSPLLAVPIGDDERRWVVLTRDRRLMRFDAGQSLLVPLARPTPTWFPNPQTWPWIGREEASGRVWVYGRRRVIELENESPAAVRMNVRIEQIPEFHRTIAPLFTTFADALADAPAPDGQTGEYLRGEIQQNGEFVADPDLPEIGVIRKLPQEPRIVHVALRGGPHLLIDKKAGRVWSSRWIADKLDLDAAPAFFAQALWDQPAPVLMLFTDQGLVRFDTAAETLTRIALPGDEPYPALIPESTPYSRRDPRFVYCARLPQDGGAVYRITVADNAVERVDMTNEALPEGFYALRTRAAIRADIDRRFQESGLPPLEEFIRDAIALVELWRRERGG